MMTPAQIHLAQAGESASGTGRRTATPRADRAGARFAFRLRTRRTQR